MAYISFAPQDYFKTILYTGNESARTITTGMQPDWVWTKCRNDAHAHISTDSVTGAGKRIKPDSNNAQDTSGASVASFVSTGYTLTDNSTINGNSDNSVSWSWKMGTTSGLSGGTITPSAYSINATTGSAFLKYTGTGSVGTIPHGLGKEPSMIIVKRTDTTSQWSVYFKDLGNGYHIPLDTADSPVDSANYWNDTSPTSSVFTVGTGTDVNASGGTYIAMVFANIKGFSQSGTYNGNNGQNFIYTGFKPSWLLMRRWGGAQWILVDNKRGYNGSNELLYPDSSEVAGSAEVVDLVSNGFCQRSSGAGNNQNTVDYFYMAFAAAPIVGSNNVPSTAR